MKTRHNSILEDDQEIIDYRRNAALAYRELLDTAEATAAAEVRRLIDAGDAVLNLDDAAQARASRTLEKRGVLCLPIDCDRRKARRYVWGIEILNPAELQDRAADRDR